MRLELQIALAIALDLLLGDPARLFHPVTGVARLGLALEGPFRWMVPSPRAAGTMLVLAVLAVSVGLVALLLVGSSRLHPLTGDLLSVLVLYTCFAARGLSAHAGRVYRGLVAGDLPAAREAVSLLVGRDTRQMDEGEAARAAVESVAENSSDAVVAPLLYAVVLGPLGAVAYKTANTLDSTFGYKNERYRQFGWASARLDDLLNLVPARLTAAVIICAAPLLRLSAGRAARVYLRDRQRHPSPNGGHPEAAMAGALGVRLGGENRYGERVEQRPFLGDECEPLGARHLKLAIRLMWAAFLLAAVIGLASRWLVVTFAAQPGRWPW